MRHHHTGSGRRLAIPADWETSFATVVANNFMLEATVNLRLPGGVAQWNEALGHTVLVPHVPFVSNVIARITPISASEVNIVEERAWVLGYRVMLPRSTASLDEGIIVDVVTCSDPLLVGSSLTVTDVVRGTHRLYRELVASLNS
jgi:hypothetical protein